MTLSSGNDSFSFDIRILTMADDSQEEQLSNMQAILLGLK